MIITFGQAKTLIAKYVGKAGRCPGEEEVDLAVKEVIQELLQRGANGNLRKWVFLTENGIITAPPDLELPIKVRVGDGSAGYGGTGIHGGHSAFVYDKWYEFYDQNTLGDCSPAERGLVEEPNTYFTAFDPPPCGARILAVPHCQEDEDAQFIIQGLDENGTEIFMPHKCERNFSGEVLSINKNEPRYTQKTFTKITGISKTPTKHYVRIYAYYPDTGKQEFLAQYKPTDTNPSFRRFRVVGADCGCAKVTVLGRIKFCDNYHDNDIIPISNLRALKVMAQTIQAEDNDNIEVAQFKNARVDQSLLNENNYKRTSQAPMDFFVTTAPGNLKPMI